MATAKQTKEQLLEDAKHEQQLLEEMNAKRKEQIEQVRGISTDLTQRLQASYSDSKKLALLQSVAIGLYDESDKLSKKAPAETASDLMLEQVNDIIRETRELLKDDLYVQRLKEFVPAGNNPQLRDVVVVLRQLRQGMERVSTNALSFQRRATSLGHQALVVITALELFMETGTAPSDDAVRYLVETSVLGPSDRDWFVYNSIYHEHYFNIDKLDRTNIAQYFEVE